MRLETSVGGYLDTHDFLCKLCLGRKAGKLYVLERSKNEKKNVVYLAACCAECGLFQTVYDWQTADKLQRERMSDLARSNYKPLWESEKELAANERKASYFADTLNDIEPLAGKRVLEVGCRRGFFLHACAKYGAASVVGQDFFDAGALEYAREVYGISDIRSVPLDDGDVWPDSEFDVICSFDVLEHIHDLRGFFEESIRILKPGGMLFHATPGFDSISNKVGRAAVGLLTVNSSLHAVGTSLCNLSAVDNVGGGAHVSLLSVRQLRWMSAHLPVDLERSRYTTSYTYSDEHYAAVIPVFNKLPAAIGTSLFKLVRGTVRNKLVFSLRIRGEPLGDKGDRHDATLPRRHETV